MRWKHVILGVRATWQQLSSELYFVQTPIPSPLGSLNKGIDGLQGLRAQKPVIQKGAQTACEAAKQACKHVDVANKSNLTTGWPTTYNPYGQPSYYRPPQQQLPPPEFWEQMMARMNAIEVPSG